jgi:hypothetical protein
MEESTNLTKACKPLAKALKKDKSILVEKKDDHEFIKDWFHKFDVEQEYGVQVFEKYLLRFTGIKFKYHN